MVQWDKEPAEISQQTFKLMGLGHAIEFKYLDRNKTVIVVNKLLSCFLNFQNASLMRCRN
jgi:hypothetical protein